MNRIARSVVLLSLAVVATVAFGRDLPSYDAVARTKPNLTAQAAAAARASEFARAGTQVQADNRFAVPTFIWAGRNTQSPSLRPGTFGSSGPEEAAARAHLGHYAELYNLSAEDVETATASQVHNIGKGPVIVKFKQSIGGIEIIMEELNVVMNRKLELVAISGYISSMDTPAAQAGANWNLDARGGIAAAYKDLTGGAISTSVLKAEPSQGGYDYFSTTTDVGFDIPARARKVYFHLPDGIVPAYHIELALRNDNNNGDLRTAGESDLDYYAYIISAVDGSLLLRRNLTVYEQPKRTRVRGPVANLGPGGFTYRVWADAVTGVPYDGPQGNGFAPKVIATNDAAQPTLVSPNNVTLPNYPFSMNDPWLAPAATETVGNNTDAYMDLVAPNGFGATGPPLDGVSNDFRGQLTAAATFGNNYDTTLRPNLATQRLASLQQMFYNVNFLHDWFYDYGFNEAGLNAQTNNFGRGGLQNDPINSEGQDMGNLDNANMNTPADGARPRMQMYIFQAQQRFVEIQSPPSIATTLNSGTVQFGPQPFDTTAELLLANPPAACAALTNAAAVNGKIVMVERQATGGPTCSLTTKLTNAQNAGAIGFVLINNQSTPTTGVSFLGFINGITMNISTITWNQALPIKTELAVPNVVMIRQKRDIDRDGTIDNQIMFHEWGHYMQNRQIGNSLGLINQQGGSMGEGWGDVNALLFTVREDDILVPSNANWNGVYAMAAYVLTGGTTSQGGYFGIRRYPYSTDMTKNPLTFKHIVDGEPMPVGPPIRANTAPNSEVHNAGEIWANMVWECYAALLRDTTGSMPRLTFQQARDRINTYYVSGQKITMLRPTFLDARDAMLAAAYATDATDYALLWAAFAKRGAGVNAVAADRYSTNHVGTIESFVVGGELVATSGFVSTGSSDCDGDGMLDSGDTVTANITLTNTGDRSLSATTGILSSSDPNITFANGGAINFPPSDPYGTTTGSVAVSMAPGVAGIQIVPFQLSYNDPNLGVAGPRIENGEFRVNTNTILFNTATDTVESERLAWTPTTVTGTFPNFITNNPWVRDENPSPNNYFWFGTDPDGMHDQALVSPAMTINGGGALNVQFDHSWGFEFDGGGNYDGGVVEMSVNGGAWTDIGVGGVNSYNGTILNQGANSNPLGGRPGFVQNSPGTVHTTLNQAIAPGSTVKVRFRIGSDQIFGANGWVVDNIAFTGIVETPFDTVVADPGCIRTTTTSVSASPNPASFGSNVTITATVNASSGTPTGTVNFFDGATPLGSNALVGNTASINTTSLSIGTHTLTAQYGGAVGFAASSSAGTSETITKAASSIGVVANVNPSTLGSPVTFTATVTGGVGTPTGSVTFLDGASPLGTVALSAGSAQLTTSSLTGGAHTINVSYAGSATYLSSSNSVAHNVSTGSTIQFNPTAYWKFEDTAMVTLTVTRTGGNTTGAASVQYATSPGTAVAGVRYTTSSATVNFGNNVTSTTFDIPLIDTVAIEGKQTFTVTLSNPNAATLGGAAVATVTIMDDDIGESDFSSPSNGGNDIVWRNESTGDTRAWEMNSTTFVSSTDLLQFGGNWRLAAVADFNADGHADILYRNAGDFSMVIWYMNGTSLISTAAVTPSVPDANWKILCAGDMNGDGFPDLIWRNSSTFSMSAWLMRDNVMLSTASLPTVPDANWQMKGTGDFNRDGKLDLVWRNENAFTTAVWLMNGTTFSSAVSLPTVGAPWNLVGVGDMNSDGDSDLIWRTSTGGNAAVWLMNQTAFGSATAIPTIAGSSWQIVAPR